MVTAEYVMFGKAKAGELKGLARLDAAAKSRVTPFLDVPRPKDLNPSAVHAHLVKTTGKICKWWGNSGLFIDHFDVPLRVRALGGMHPLETTFDHLRTAGVAAIPVYGFDRDEAYLEAIAAIQARLRRGVCLRLLEDDMEDPSQAVEEIIRALSRFALTPKSVDIVLDFRSLVQKQLRMVVSHALNTINAIQRVGQFRSIIVAGSNYPRNVSDVPADGIGFVERRELLVWERIRSALQNGTHVHFGDYSVVHPDFVDVENTRNANAKIRYTIRGNWLVSRGHMLREEPGFLQYHDVARRVVRANEFMGPHFSWGDQYIANCAEESDGPGNLAKWVEVDVCHHVSFVMQEIAERVLVTA